MTEAQQPLPGTPWFSIPDPNSPALDKLAKRFHLHELQIEDCRHRPQRAKTDEYGEYIFSILKHVQQVGDELDFDDLDIFRHESRDWRSCGTWNQSSHWDRATWRFAAV